MLVLKSKFISVLISFILVVVFLFFQIYLTIYPDFLTGSSFPGSTNEYCNKIKLKQNNSNYIEMNTCKNEYKKSKFLWILIDGLAYDQLNLIRNRTKYKIPNLFKISTHHYRQSGSLHETYLTGKFSRNLPANEIKIDHILTQAAQSDFSLYYRGSNFPLYFLLGEKESKILQNFEIRKNERFPFQNMCENTAFLNLNEVIFPEYLADLNGDLLVSKEEFSNYLQDNHKWNGHTNLITECLLHSKIYSDNDPSSSNSLVFYTMMIDHINHSFYKYNSYALRNVYSIEVSLLYFMNWIQLHPEYALVVTSDHGGQSYYGEDNICNHGCMNKGNEAVMMIYTKELANSRADLKLIDDVDAEIEDVAPTIAQIFENVNIPLESTGFPMFLNKDKFLNLIALKMKEIQLMEKIKVFFSKKRFDQILHNILIEIENSEYSDAINKIKNKNDLNLIESFDDFLLKYKRFLKSKQSEIIAQIKITSNSKILSFLFYFVFLFLAFNFFSSSKILIKCFRKESKSNLSEIIFSSTILLISFLDILFALISKDVIETYNKIHLYFFILILITCLIIDKFYFSRTYDKLLLNKKINFKKFQIGLFVISFLVLFCNYFNIFLNLKNAFSRYETGKKLDVLNYSILIVYLICQTKKLNQFYCFSNKIIRIDKLLFSFYALLIPLMIIFDYSYPKHFINQTYPMKMLVRTIYTLILIFMLLTLKRFYRKEGESLILFKLIKFPFVLYLYFISDEAERIFLLTLILPLFYFISSMIKSNDGIIRLLAFVSLLMLPDVCYTLKKGSFSFDVSLKVCTKSIGDYPDQTPLFTGFLMGSHKMSLFIIFTLFILDHIEYGRDFVKNYFYQFRIIMEMHWNLLIIIYLYYIYKDYEELYLNVFLWTATKCIYIIFLDFVSFTHFFLNYDPSYKKIISEDVSTEEDIDKLT